MNESLSSQLDGRLPWSYSTSFYPGESTFSSIYDDHVLKHVGLNKENGGKFQVLPVATIVTAEKLSLICFFVCVIPALWCSWR